MKQISTQSSHLAVWQRKGRLSCQPMFEVLKYEVHQRNCNKTKKENEN